MIFTNFVKYFAILVLKNITKTKIKNLRHGSLQMGFKTIQKNVKPVYAMVFEKIKFKNLYKNFIFGIIILRIDQSDFRTICLRITYLYIFM